MSAAMLVATFVGGLCIVYLLLRFVRHPQQGLYLTIFASAILLSPSLPVVREKLTAAEFVVALTWLALLLRAGRKSVRTVPLTSSQRTSLLLGGAFTGWMLLSFAINQIDVIERQHFTASAVEATNFVYGYLMFATVVWLVDDWQDLRGCLLAWFAGAGVVSLFGVWAVAGGAPAWAYDDFTHRISSTLRTENQVPMYLMPVVVALAFWAVQRRRGQLRRLGALLLLGAVLVTLAGTGSRTAFGMTILAVVAVIWLALIEAPRRGFNKGLLFNLSVGLVVTVGVYVALAVSTYQGDYVLGKTPAWQRPVVMLYDWTQGYQSLDATRPAQLAQAYHYFWDQPLIGTGPKLYGYQYRMAEIHNTYMGVLLQMGVVGLGFFLAWVTHTLWLGWRTGRSLREPFQRLMVLSLCVGMVLLLVYGMTMFGLRQRNLWLLAGLLVAAHSLRRQEIVARRAAAPAPAAAPRAGFGYRPAES